MPNVNEMRIRLASHMARVSGKAIDAEFKRINALAAYGRISSVTRNHMVSSAAIRLAWKANAA
jgi:hypothetical protein